MIALFIFGQTAAKEIISTSLGQEVLECLLHCGLLSESRPEILVANVLLLSFGSLLIASDRNDYAQADEVWTPSEQTFKTEPFLPQQAKHSLDMGTGSGILALLMSDRSEAVHGIDINPRAIEFARFNAWFNECSNVSFETASCATFASKTSDSFNVITGVFPDLMVGSVWKKGPISRVVPDGMGLSKDLYSNLDGLLKLGGMCVFWHGIMASKQSIGDFFETRVVGKGHLPDGYEVLALSAIKGGQETGIFLAKGGSARQPALFSRLSASLGITDADELLELTRARRWFHSLHPEERQDALLRVWEGIRLGIEHKFEKGRFQGQKYQIGRYQFSPHVFELLQLIDGARTFCEITQQFLRDKLGDEAAAESKDRKGVEQTLCDLVEKGIVGPVQA